MLLLLLLQGDAMLLQRSWSRYAIRVYMSINHTTADHAMTPEADDGLVALWLSAECKKPTRALVRYRKAVLVPIWAGRCDRKASSHRPDGLDTHRGRRTPTKTKTVPWS